MHRYKQNKRDDQSAANHRQTTGKPTLYIPFHPTPSGDGLFCDPTPAPVMPDHKKKRGAECLETNYALDESEEESDDKQTKMSLMKKLCPPRHSRPRQPKAGGGAGFDQMICNMCYKLVGNM
jgi:hypothetical protein